MQSYDDVLQDLYFLVPGDDAFSHESKSKLFKVISIHLLARACACSVMFSGRYAYSEQLSIEGEPLRSWPIPGVKPEEELCTGCYVALAMPCPLKLLECNNQQVTTMKSTEPTQMACVTEFAYGEACKQDSRNSPLPPRLP